MKRTFILFVSLTLSILVSGKSNQHYLPSKLSATDNNRMSKLLSRNRGPHPSLKSAIVFSQKLDSLIITQPDNATGNWINSEKYVFFSENNDTINYEIDYAWNNESKEWEKASRWDYQYSGNSLTQTESEIDTTTSSWVPSNKWVFSYDESGNDTLEVLSVYDTSTGGWNISSKERIENTYTTFGRPSQQIYYLWDSASSSWALNYKYEYKYNEQEYEQNLYGYSLDENGEWQNDYRDSSLWEKEGANDEYYTFQINSTDSSWQYATKGIAVLDYNYSAEGLVLPYYIDTYYFGYKMTQYKKYSWDNTTTTWAESEETNYYFSDLSDDETSKTISCTAGALDSLLTSEEKSNITSLTITGTIDARDFVTMRDNLDSLTVLDLSNVTIAEYYGSNGTQKDYDSIYPANEVPAYAFYNQSIFKAKKTLQTIKLPVSLKSIGKSAFWNCSGLKGTLTIPGETDKVEEYAFYACTKIDTLIFEEGVDSLLTQSFFACLGLDQIKISSTVSYIHYLTFGQSDGNIEVAGENEKYKSIDGMLYSKDATTIIHCPISYSGSYTLPETVTAIGNDAFTNCDKLTGIAFSTSVSSIGEYAFSNSGLTQVDIPTSLTVVMGAGAFENSSIETLVIPSNVTAVPMYAFEGCKLLTNLEIKADSTTLGSYSFANCTKLSGITLNDGVVSISQNAFSEADSLKQIEIPGSVRIIGSQAFSGCDNLSKATLNEGTDSIESFAFSYSTTDTLFINLPSTMSFIGNGAFAASNCEISNSSKYFSVIDGNLYNNDTTKLMYYAPRKSESFEIPSTVKIIAGYAFYNCDSLTTLSIPASVDSLESSSFVFCSNLSLIYTYREDPIVLDPYVFGFFVSDTCTLYVPFGSLEAYSTADVWKNFYAIKEMAGFKLSGSDTILLPASATDTTITVTSNTTWVAISDKEWLYVVLPTNTIGGDGFIGLLAQDNTENTSRTATVTVSAEGVESQTITVVQEAYNSAAKTNLDQLTVYPNPVGEEFQIKGNTGTAKICIYDMQGKALLSKTVSGNEHVSMSGFQKGIYLLTVNNGKGTSSLKIKKE